MFQETKSKFDCTHNFFRSKNPLENIFEVSTTATYSRQSGIVLMVIVSSSDLWWHSHLPNNERKPNFPTLIINGCETEVTSIDSHRVKRTISLFAALSPCNFGHHYYSWLLLYVHCGQIAKITLFKIVVLANFRLAKLIR